MTTALQKPLRKAKSSNLKRDEERNEIVDGVSCANIKVKANCDMDEFEALARVLRLNSEDSNESQSVKFYPDFSITQNPSLSETQFYITFSSLAVACKHLGITSKADQLEMMQRDGFANHGLARLLRVPATYVYDEKEEGKECVILPGQSCGVEMQNSSEDNNGVPALVRDTRK